MMYVYVDVPFHSLNYRFVDVLVCWKLIAVSVCTHVVCACALYMRIRRRLRACFGGIPLFVMFAIQIVSLLNLSWLVAVIQTSAAC